MGATSLARLTELTPNQDGSSAQQYLRNLNPLTTATQVDGRTQAAVEIGHRAAGNRSPDATAEDSDRRRSAGQVMSQETVGP